MDLTKIEKPFGLLDEATQKALRECGGPYETFAGNIKGEWESCFFPAWVAHAAYRVKPKPPKPREWWIVKSYAPFCTREDAEKWARDEYPVIHVREVLSDD